MSSNAIPGDNDFSFRDWFGSLVEISFNVRDTPTDLALAILIISTVILFAIIYLIYLFVKSFRGRKAGVHRSKADRPSWVLGLLLSSSSWLLGTALSGGTLYITPEQLNNCSNQRFTVQYAFGYIPWISLIIYKLIRKYYQARLVGRRPPHAILANLILVIWMIGYSIGPLVLDSSGRDEDQICKSDLPWLVGLYTIVPLYFCLALFLIVKIRRTIGTHHEVIRYCIFLATSSVFPLVDGIVQFGNWGVVPQKTLLLLVWLIVTMNMAHVFVLILIPRKRKNKEGILPYNNEQLRGAPLLSVSSVSTFASSERKDLGNAFLPSTDRQSNFVTTKPRRDASCEMLPDFERFLDSLPEELAQEVDRNRGYFAYKSRPKTRTIVEFDLDRAIKYLDAK